MLTDMY